MIEVKAANQTDNEDVQEKAKAAIKWCECASQVDADGKEPNVEMAMEFDKNRFWKLLVETLKEYGK